MTCFARRLYRGESRLAVCQNLDSRVDRETLGVWYLSLYLGWWYVSLMGTSRLVR